MHYNSSSSENPTYASEYQKADMKIGATLDAVRYGLQLLLNILPLARSVRLPNTGDRVENQNLGQIFRPCGNNQFSCVQSTLMSVQNLGRFVYTTSFLCSFLPCVCPNRSLQVKGDPRAEQSPYRHRHSCGTGGRTRTSKSSSSLAQFGVRSRSSGCIADLVHKGICHLRQH